MRNKVLILLVVTLLIIGIFPLISNYFLLNDILETQEKIYLNADLNRSLLDYEASLKKLSKFDPVNEKEYRNKFQDLQNLKLLYGEDTYFSKAVRSTSIKYFFLLFGIIIFISFFTGTALSFKVNKMYVKSLDELIKAKEKSLFLNEIAKWKEVAQKIAHEMRRPIQPIRIWVSQLKKQSSANTIEVKEAAIAIEEEILFLSNMVNEFSDFASVPKPKLEKVDFGQFMKNFVVQYKDIWTEAKFNFVKTAGEFPVLLDAKLFRTLLANLVENAIDANLNKEVDFTLDLHLSEDQLQFSIFNTGVELSAPERERIFDMYYSTKNTHTNKGLGLTIVKTIVLEHNGEIQCLEAIGGVKFQIRLPLFKRKI